MSGSTNQRLTSIDALRGLAVLLMLTQHVVYWVCAHLHASMTVRAAGALGGLAAPIFVVLAGLGATLTSERHANSDYLLLGRGLMVLGFGYSLNLLTPSWFSMVSWYVLHMIGFGLMLAPTLRRASDTVLMVLLIAAVVATALIQNILDTPFFLYNPQMARTDLPGGMLRLALAEGYFPVFPWIAYFMAGLLAGRWLMRGARARIGRLAAVLLVISAALSFVYLAGIDFAGNTPWVRFFKPIPNFYPALTPVTLFLMGVVLFFIVAFEAIQKRIALGPSNVLVCLGRCSLSILIVHVAVLRESAVRLGFWRTLSVPETLAVTFALLFFFALAALWWRRIHFRFGAEWLMRKAFP